MPETVETRITVVEAVLIERDRFYLASFDAQKLAVAAALAAAQAKAALVFGVVSVVAAIITIFAALRK